MYFTKFDAQKNIPVCCLKVALSSCLEAVLGGVFMYTVGRCLVMVLKLVEALLLDVAAPCLEGYRL